MIKFELLAPFPVDPLPHQVVSNLIFFLREFTAFAFYVIDRFVSIIIIIIIQTRGCWNQMSSLYH